MGGASIWHWVVVGLIVMLLFGRGKISEMMGDVAKGIKAFKKGMSDEDEVATTSVTGAPVTGTSATTTTTVVEPVRSLDHRTADGTHAAAPAAASSAGTTTLSDRKVG